MGPWVLKSQVKGGSEAGGLDLAVFSPVISQSLHLSWIRRVMLRNETKGGLGIRHRGTST